MHVLLKGKQCYVWIQFEMTYTHTSISNFNDRALHIILKFISLQTPGIMNYEESWILNLINKIFLNRLLKKIGRKAGKMPPLRDSTVYRIWDRSSAYILTPTLRLCVGLLTFLPCHAYNYELQYPYETEGNILGVCKPRGYEGSNHCKSLQKPCMFFCSASYLITCNRMKHQHKEKILLFNWIILYKCMYAYAVS